MTNAAHRPAPSGRHSPVGTPLVTSLYAGVDTTVIALWLGCAARRSVVSPAQRAEMRGDTVSLDLMADLDLKSEGNNSMMRHEAPRRIPGIAGKNSEEHSWA